MIYESEQYRKERPEADQITHLPSGKVYETIAQACLAANVSPYKMRKYIRDGKIWSRPSGSAPAKKQVRCVETGKVYSSISDAARAYSEKSHRVSAHIAGQIRSIRGFHFELTGDYTPPKPTVYRRKPRVVPPDTFSVSDDTGKTYAGVNHISRETGLTRREVVERLRLDPDGVFRTAWVNDCEYRNARYDGKIWWINGTIPAATFRKFQSLLRLMGKRVTAKEAKRLTGDLFG